MDVYHRKEPDSFQRYTAEITVCTEIAAVRRLTATRHASELYGWPVTIDFAQLPARIMKIKGTLQDRVRNRAFLTGCFIWKSLLDDIQRKGLTMYQIAQKGMVLPVAVTAPARPG